MLISNFILSLLVSASLQYLWGMISAQQIVVLLPLFNVQIPANTYLFFEQLMMIAAFDLIPTDSIYERLSPSAGDAISSAFEQLGFEHHLIMNNFGTLGLTFAFLPILYAFYMLVSLFKHQAKACLRYRESLRNKLFYGYLIRLIMESFVIGMICSLISMRVILFRDEYQDDEERDMWVQANEIIAYFATSIFLLFPIIGTVFLFRRFNQLEETHF